MASPSSLVLQGMTSKIYFPSPIPLQTVTVRLKLLVISIVNIAETPYPQVYLLAKIDVGNPPATLIHPDKEGFFLLVSKLLSDPCPLVQMRTGKAHSFLKLL